MTKSNPRILFVSNLYPDSSAPGRGIMNARLLRNLAGLGNSICVISPRPSLRMAGNSPYESLPDDPFPTHFVSVPYLPKVGSRWNDLLMRRYLRKSFREEVENFRPDFVLGAWMYPDGCAVADLAEEMNLPCGLIAQGTDLHSYLENPVRRNKILRAIDRADITITRSESLKKLLVEEGADSEKIRTIYNGVDTRLFHPGDPASARSRLNLPDKTPLVLFVGNLLPIKDPVFLVHAIARMKLPPLLVIVGDGPLESEIRSLSANLGISDRVLLVGRQSPETIALYMQAADLLCLSSRNEGLPNVILEAFASGLPVVAADVGGVSEVVSHPFLGSLVSHGHVEEFSKAIETRLLEPADREAIREHGRGYSWERTCQRYLEAISEVRLSFKSRSSSRIGAIQSYLDIVDNS